MSPAEDDTCMFLEKFFVAFDFCPVERVFVWLNCNCFLNVAPQLHDTAGQMGCQCCRMIKRWVWLCSHYLLFVCFVPLFCVTWSFWWIFFTFNWDWSVLTLHLCFKAFFVCFFKSTEASLPRNTAPVTSSHCVNTVFVSMLALLMLAATASQSHYGWRLLALYCYLLSNNLSPYLQSQFKSLLAHITISCVVSCRSIYNMSALSASRGLFVQTVSQYANSHPPWLLYFFTELSIRSESTRHCCQGSTSPFFYRWTGRPNSAGKRDFDCRLMKGHAVIRIPES